MKKETREANINRFKILEARAKNDSTKFLAFCISLITIDKAHAQQQLLEYFSKNIVSDPLNDQSLLSIDNANQFYPYIVEDEWSVELLTTQKDNRTKLYEFLQTIRIDLNNEEKAKALDNHKARLLLFLNCFETAYKDLILPNHKYVERAKKEVSENYKLFINFASSEREDIFFHNEEKIMLKVYELCSTIAGDIAKRVYLKAFAFELCEQINSNNYELSQALQQLTAIYFSIFSKTDKSEAAGQLEPFIKVYSHSNRDDPGKEPLVRSLTELTRDVKWESFETFCGFYAQAAKSKSKSLFDPRHVVQRFITAAVTQDQSTLDYFGQQFASPASSPVGSPRTPRLKSPKGLTAQAAITKRDSVIDFICSPRSASKTAHHETKSTSAESSTSSDFDTVTLTTPSNSQGGTDSSESSRPLVKDSPRKKLKKGKAVKTTTKQNNINWTTVLAAGITLSFTLIGLGGIAFFAPYLLPAALVPAAEILGASLIGLGIATGSVCCVGGAALILNEPKQKNFSLAKKKPQQEKPTQPKIKKEQAKLAKEPKQTKAEKRPGLTFFNKKSGSKKTICCLSCIYGLFGNSENQRNPQFQTSPKKA